MDEDDLKNYLLNVLNDTKYIVESKIYENNKKSNKKKDYFIIKKELY